MARPGTILNAEIIKEIPRRLGLERIRLFRRNIATVQADGRFFRCGLPGMADVFGIVNIHGHGVSVEIEGKVPPDRPTAEQISWGNMITGMGGIFIIARSVDDCEQQLRAAIARLEKTLCP